MAELAKGTTELAKGAADTIALLTHYSFDLGNATPEELFDGWSASYKPNWIRLAVIEALYQGRYKGVSVEQILVIWQRRGQPLQHFNHEFERLVCNKLPKDLTLLNDNGNPGDPPRVEVTLLPPRLPIPLGPSNPPLPPTLTESPDSTSEFPAPGETPVSLPGDNRNGDSPGEEISIASDHQPSGEIPTPSTDGDTAIESPPNPGQSPDVPETPSAQDSETVPSRGSVQPPPAISSAPLLRSLANQDAEAFPPFYEVDSAGSNSQSIHQFSPISSDPEISSKLRSVARVSNFWEL